MATEKPPRGKKFFTVAEANAALPLVRAILRDITELAGDLRARHDRLTRSRTQRGAMGDAYHEEMEQAERDFERDQDRLREYEEELNKLGVLLKDYHTGLIDFPCWMDDHEVYLCWRLGEDEVAHWHEIDAGFAGRRKIEPATANKL